MDKHGKRAYAALVLALLVCVCGLAAFFTHGALAQDLFKAEYERNTILSVPDNKIEVNGKKYPADAVVTFPDGSAVIEKKVMLKDFGRYTVDYRAVVDGKNYSERYFFTVPYTVCTLSDDLNDRAVYETRKGVTALYANLSNYADITFNTLIPREQLTKDQDIIKCFVYPNTDGKADCLGFYIDVMDSADESNFFSMHVRASEYEGHANGVVFISARPSDNPEDYGYEQGLPDGLFVTWDYYGFAARGSFTGVGFGNPRYVIKMSYDDSTKTLYSANNVYGPEGTEVIAFDDKRFFDKPLYGYYLWEGFKGSHVKVRIRADEYLSSYMTIGITSLLGCDLSAKYIAGNKSAEPMVDTGAYGEGNYPLAEVGRPYPLFPAKTCSNYTRENLSVRVFTGYGSEFKSDVNVADGCFLPERTGVYTIEYKATDAYGDTSVKLIPVTAVKKLEPIEFTLGEAEYDVGIGGYFTPALVTEKSGGSGELKARTYIRKKGTEELTEIEGSFRITEKADYEIIYEVTDYLGNKKTEIRELSVKDSAAPDINDPYIFPRAVVAGADFKVPDIKADDFSTGILRQIGRAHV